MAFPIDNETMRFGSAQFASAHDAKRAGLFRKSSDSVLLGYLSGKPLYFGGQGGIATVAGARSGKLRDVLGYTLCGASYAEHIVCLDVKAGELAAISQNQTRLMKPCIYWNPRGIGGFPVHRINPVDHIHVRSPSLVSDVKVFCENVITLSGSANGQYFEQRARELVEALCLTLVERDGSLTLPALYGAINLAMQGGDEWLSLAFEMHESRFPLVRRVEEEIHQGREDGGGGFRGILGEVAKSFQALSDPVLMASVSPPFDFSFEALIRSSKRYNVYLMPPVEYLDAWAPIIKALFVSAMTYKSRAPGSARQLWILDECAQLGAFPLALKLFTFGAGIDIRPWAVFQSVNQMDALGRNARSILLSSAAVQQYFGVRDIETAQAISRMCGQQTLEYNDALAQAGAAHAKRMALQAFMAGDDPVRAAFEARHYSGLQRHRTKQVRDLRTADEVLATPDDSQYIFCDPLSHPLYAQRMPYYEQRFMAGLFHPNPFHPPRDQVRIKTRSGFENRRIIEGAVPAQYTHLPQYQSRPYSYVEGF